MGHWSWCNRHITDTTTCTHGHLSLWHPFFKVCSEINTQIIERLLERKIKAHIPIWRIATLLPPQTGMKAITQINKKNILRQILFPSLNNTWHFPYAQNQMAEKIKYKHSLLFIQRSIYKLKELLRDPFATSGFVIHTINYGLLLWEISYIELL